MIYTLTCNPSLDYMTKVTDFQLGKTNRTTAENLVAGGKGINVSAMLRNLGFESICLGFVAGFTGEEIAKQVNQMGLTPDFIKLPYGMSRINVKLSCCNADQSYPISETEINGSGPESDPVSLEQLQKRIEKIQQGDVLILSGSIPKSMPDTLYKDIMGQLEAKEIKILVDAAGSLLSSTLSCHPFIVKPNKQELEELYHVAIEQDHELLFYARKLQLAGAKNVLVSVGADGAFLLTEDGEVYRAKAPKGKLINAVGAGDSMVAGFLAGYLETKDYRYAFTKGVAAGSASAFAQGFATGKEVEDIISQVHVELFSYE